MLSIAKGSPSPDYYLRKTATDHTNYYTGKTATGTEPPGRWWGLGAAQLGLSGDVDETVFRGMYAQFLDPRDERAWVEDQWSSARVLGSPARQYQTPAQLFEKMIEQEPDASGERREQLQQQAAKQARQNRGLYDMTFSPVKSVTTLHAAVSALEARAEREGHERHASAWGVYRQVIEDAVWAGNQAALSYVQDNATYSRVGKHGSGAGRWTQGQGLTVASFFQHTSDAHDPQLHIHNAIWNRVEGEDGAWRTLDGRQLYEIRAAAGAVGDRVMEEELSQRLGLTWVERPDGHGREIAQVPQEACDLLSTRSRALGTKAQALEQAFRERTGREPTALERAQIRDEATVSTRTGRESTESTEQRLQRIEATVQAKLNVSFETIARRVLHRGPQPPTPSTFSPSKVKAEAAAVTGGKDSSWSRGMLAQAIGEALPPHLGVDAEGVRRLIDGLTDEALAEYAVDLRAAEPGEQLLPEQLRLPDGSSAYRSPTAGRWTSVDQWEAEQQLLQATRDRSGPHLHPAQAAAVVKQARANGVPLSPDQEAAIRGILTSGAMTEVLVGPAGTGKSTVMGVVAEAWANPDLWADGQPRQVVGLATSQEAADNLAGDGLPTTHNIARWITSHGEAALQSGDLVIVDESAMTSTPDLLQVAERTHAAGAELLLTGDHRQISAVGAGGGMSLIADSGSMYELTEVHRFHHHWERDASLRLRLGDASVLAEYRRHGRFIDCGDLANASSRAVRGYLADRLSGLDTVLTTNSNEHAAELSAQVRAELVRLGLVEEYGVQLGFDGNVAGVGDAIQARVNDRRLRGYEGNDHAATNRDRYTVTHVWPDGSVTARREADGDRMQLDADYVARHVSLDYAGTRHAVEGRTVDTSHAVLDPAVDAAGVYVPLTRGRDCNTGYVATRHDDTGEQVGGDLWSTLQEALARGEPDKAAVVQHAEAAQEARSAKTVMSRVEDGAHLAVAERTRRHLDELMYSGALDPADRSALAASSSSMPALTDALRRVELAGHDPAAALRAAVEQGPLTGARDAARVVTARVTSQGGDLTPVHTPSQGYAAWMPADVGAEWQSYLAELAEAADQRHQELAAGVAADPPTWAETALGSYAEAADPEAWVQAAATMAMHRELDTRADEPDVESNVDEEVTHPNDQDGDDAAAVVLPPAPSPQQDPVKYASWHAAWTAAGQPQHIADEAQLGAGALYARVRAWDREQQWQPVHVAQDLAGVRQQLARRQQDATLAEAEAAAATDSSQRAEAERQAGEARAEVAELTTKQQQLEQADQVRSAWYLQTAPTRAAARRAARELDTRGIEPDRLHDTTAAEEWLQADAEATRVEDAYRSISEDDLDTRGLAAAAAELFPAEDTDAEEIATDTGPLPQQRSEPDIPGLHTGRSWTHVPDRTATEHTVDRAHRALTDLAYVEDVMLGGPPTDTYVPEAGDALH